MIKKISLPVLVTVMCLLLSVVMGLVYLNQKKVTKVTSKPKTEVARTDYSSVARKTLDWIDKQRNDEGWYILERGCDFDKKTCDTVWDNEEGNKDGLIATWARFNFYKQAKDPKDLEIVKSDINKFYEKYPNGVDNALWICKITYDMWKSDVFDSNLKDKLQNICFKSSFRVIALNKHDYTKKIINLVDVESSSKSWLGYTLTSRGVDGYFGLTSDLLDQYLWTKDESKLDLAKQYFESGKKIIEEMGNNVKANDNCLLALSAIDLYEYGGRDENVLNYAKEKYLNYGDGYLNEYRTAICVLMAKRLYRVTGSNTFLDGLEINKRLMVNGLLDGGNSKSNITGTYGFFATSYGGAKYLYKDILENGLMVELLRD